MASQKITGASIAYLNIIVNFSVLIFFQPIIMEYLGINQYGFYALFASMLTYLSLFDFGLGNTAVVKLSYSLKLSQRVRVRKSLLRYLCFFAVPRLLY